MTFTVTVSMDSQENSVKLTLMTVKIIRVKMAFVRIKLEGSPALVIQNTL